MNAESERFDYSQSQTAYTRRKALKRGAAVGGALVWAVPAVQVISMSSANAESPSSPPQPPKQEQPDSPQPPKEAGPGDTQPSPGPGGSGGGDSGGGQSTGGPVSVVQDQPRALAAPEPETLAYTGFPTSEAVVAGAGLLAAGTALTAGATRPKSAEPEPDAS